MGKFTREARRQAEMDGLVYCGGACNKPGTGLGDYDQIAMLNDFSHGSVSNFG